MNNFGVGFADGYEIMFFQNCARRAHQIYSILSIYYDKQRPAEYSPRVLACRKRYIFLKIEQILYSQTPSPLEGAYYRGLPPLVPIGG